MLDYDYDDEHEHETTMSSGTHDLETPYALARFGGQAEGVDGKEARPVGVLSANGPR